MKQFSGWVLVSYALLAIVASTVSALYDGRPGARILLEPDESKIVYIVTLEGKPVVAEYDDLYNDVDEASNKKLKIDPASVSRTASRRSVLVTPSQSQSHTCSQTVLTVSQSVLHF